MCQAYNSTYSLFIRTPRYSFSWCNTAVLTLTFELSVAVSVDLADLHGVCQCILSDRTYCFICMRVFVWQRDGSSRVTGAVRGQRGWLASDGRTDRMDGWKYHVTACDGLRQELSATPSRTAALPGTVRPSASVSIPQTPAGRLSTRNAAERTPTGNWKIWKGSANARRNPSGMPAGWGAALDGQLSLNLCI